MTDERTDERAEHPGVSHRAITRIDRTGATHDDTWGIAVEAPVAILINGVPWTVMLATPSDLEDLAIGMLLTEHVIDSASRITSIGVGELLDEFTVSVDIPDEAIDREALGARTLISNTACGLCGIESLADLHRRRGEWQAVVSVNDDAIRLALRTLPGHQPLNAATHSVHAAAWCALDGSIQLVREDVGRHNALDKLVGSLARAGRLAEQGFVLMSSRCSYELVYKTSVLNAQALASVSAPTNLALRWAGQLGIPLVTCLGRGDALEIVRFTPPASPPFDSFEDMVHVGR